jgi:hypothetical protein
MLGHCGFVSSSTTNLMPMGYTLSAGAPNQDPINGIESATKEAALAMVLTGAPK